MHLKVHPITPAPTLAAELKPGDKFTSTMAPGACVYTRLNVPLASPYAALTDTLGLARLDANQSVYRYPAEPETTTVGELAPGDLCQSFENGHVYMVGDQWHGPRNTERTCMLLSSPSAQPGTVVRLTRDCRVIKVEVVS